MAKRVYLDEDGLLVSYPTYDADVASLENLIFSDEYRMTKVVESGEFAFSTGTTNALLADQSYVEAPRFRFAMEFDTFAVGISGGGLGGESANRDDLNQWESLCPVYVAAPSWTNSTYNSQTGFFNTVDATTRDISGSWYFNVYVTVGEGTVFYEILEEI